MGRTQRHVMHFLLVLVTRRTVFFQRTGPAYISVLGADETVVKNVLRFYCALSIILTNLYNVKTFSYFWRNLS